MILRLINDFKDGQQYEFGDCLDLDASPDEAFGVLMREEMSEFTEAYNDWLNARSMLNITPDDSSLRQRDINTEKEMRALLVDALADVSFVALGALHHLGLNSELVLEEICRSNLSKDPIFDSERTGGRDAFKGERYFAPRLLQMINRSPALYLDMGKYRKVNERPTRYSYALIEAASLRRLKGKDYMSGGVTREDLNPFGISSYVHNVVEKVMRILSLVRGKKNPNHEGVRDSAVDAINFTCFLIEELDGQTVNE